MIKVSSLKSHFPLIVILVLAAALRFANYPQRIIVSLDQGRDALIGLYSLEHYRLPLLGPPSSSWGFNFGPLYYYFITFFEATIPHLLSPWIGFSLLSLISVLLAYKIGESIDRKLAIIFSLLTALSFGEIENSVNLLNTALVSFAVFAAFYCASKIYAKRYLYSSLLGFFVGLAVNCHLQSLPLLVLIPTAALLFPNGTKNKIKVLVGSLAGLLVSFLPLLLFESQHYFAWTKSILDYTLHGQQKFYIPVRWLTELTEFWPGQFGRVMFGEVAFGKSLFVVLALALIISIIKKNKPDKLFLSIATIFIFEVLSVRYYKGPRSPEYFVFVNFFVLALVSWSLHFIDEGLRKLGVFQIIVFATAGLIFSSQLATRSSHATDTLKLFRYLETSINKPISLHVLPNSFENAYTLYYLLQKSGLGSDKGIPVGLCDTHEKGFCPASGKLFISGRFILYDPETFSESDKNAYPTEQVDPQKLFLRTYNNYELKKY